jgi:ferric-dicitrate binding protein FerR (iron transport regulator)
MRRLVVAVALCSLPLTARAAGEAVLKASRGHVSVRSAATRQWTVAQPGMELNRNDQVMTGKNGAVQLSFANGATMLVKERSRFSLSADKWGRLVRFRSGEFLIGLRKKLEGADRFRVRTPIAVAAVRGTVFWGKSDPTEGDKFACFTGFIEVYAKGKNITLEPGQLTSIAPQQPPADPQPSNIDPAYLQNFAVDGSLQGIDEQISAESTP